MNPGGIPHSLPSSGSAEDIHHRSQGNLHNDQSHDCCFETHAALHIDEIGQDPRRFLQHAQLVRQRLTAVGEFIFIVKPGIKTLQLRAVLEHVGIDRKGHNRPHLERFPKITHSPTIAKTRTQPFRIAGRLKHYRGNCQTNRSQASNAVPGARGPRRWFYATGTKFRGKRHRGGPHHVVQGCAHDGDRG
jgi:hypothetical protein